MPLVAWRHVLLLLNAGSLLLLLGGLSACTSKTRPHDFISPQAQLYTADLDNDITYHNPVVAPRLQRVIQYEGKLPLNIAEYDRQGRLIFHHYKQYVGDYWPGRYLTMITAHVYEGERLVRTYELHSNVGFTITDYEYGWLGWRVRAYRRKSAGVKDEEINTNPYRYINDIQRLSQLLIHSQVQVLERTGKKYLASEWRYGPDKQIHQDMYWDEQGRPAGKAVRLYNAQQQLVRWTILEEGKVDFTLALIYDQHQRLKQWLTCGEVRDTSMLHIYQRTGEGRVQHDFSFTNHFSVFEAEDEFNKTTYRYSPRGLVIQQTVSAVRVNNVCGLNCEGLLRTETIYHHNTEGYVLEAITQDYSTGERTRKAYRYSYQYWPLSTSTDVL